ncbi:hypothetical protein F5B22DRAFT_651014 [Xylaria bambusicola]|uniref:uncharacterized protein n=1 Tax=Xylaria bambusicola TaxID=326684 RepID=UPI0020072612|nr:uncharacterized protein F5B22DRAFT_651014 [Xylaria bambusicola]KAI0506192.1 hypothetical protein F5B22DRAFT_651014 [Xylaria bambusicola]
MAVQTTQSSTLGAHPQSSATTAPVREHACLFTHDLRRKQKRWQDGRLKYHTFNRRVMVYDERGNFVGDMHWREDYDLADGDELELERGGVLIQVGECVGSRDQDLSDLIDKRAQERAQRQAAAAARRPPVTAVPSIHSIKQQPISQKHLHDVIGTPSGHHGRAVLSKKSPYEERRQRQPPPHSDDSRPAKRQRREASPPGKSGYAQNLFGATLILSGRPSSQGAAHSRSMPRHALLHADTTPLRTDNYARLDISKRPEPTIDTNPSTLDESNTSPTSQKQRRRLVLHQDKKITGEQSVVDSQSPNKITRECRATNEHPAQIGLVSDQSRGLVSGTAERTDKVRNKKRADPRDDCTKGNRHREKNLIDLTEDQADDPQRPLPEEPRTELRIKPRKKRGLLMISERDPICSSLSNSNTTRLSNGKGGHNSKSANVSLHTSVEYLEKTREPAPRRRKASEKSVDYQESRAANTCPSEDEEFTTQRVIRHKPEFTSRAKLRATTENSDDDRTESCALANRKSLRLAQQVTNENTASTSVDQDRVPLRSTSREDNITTDEGPAPRLAKLGRKSIKSKEVIGFVFDDDSDSLVNIRQNEHVQDKTSLDLTPNGDPDKQPNQFKSRLYEDPITNERPPSSKSQASKNRSLSGRASPTTQTEEASLSIATASTKESKPTISNPATRGKKAAKPSDAAGQMPKCPLPAELVESSLRRNPETKKGTRIRDKSMATPLPGFSRANGGPWSREAHDLFDFKRPS